MKFADPRNDVTFKKIFGDENKKEILISFLNNLLDLTMPGSFVQHPDLPTLLP